MKLIKTYNKYSKLNSEFTKKVSNNYKKYSKYCKKPKIFIKTK